MAFLRGYVVVGYEQARVNTRTEQPKTVIRYNSHGLLSHIVTLFGYLRLVLFIYLFVYLLFIVDAENFLCLKD